MSTKSIPQNQMSLFDWEGSNNQSIRDDPRPLPLIVAERYKFPLRYVQDDAEIYWYSATDWIAGITGDADYKAARKQWTYLKKENPQLASPTRQLKMTAMDGKKYLTDCLQDEGLYLVAQIVRATKEREQLRKVREYLAKAGVNMDFIRLHPDEAARQIQSAADRQYIKRLLGWGYTETELPALLAERHETVTVRLDFQHTLHLVTNGQGKYAIITNIEYQGMFGRNADQIRSETGTRSAREGMHPIAQQFCRLAEMSCTEAYRQHGRLTHDQAAEIMRGIASGLKLSVKVIQEKTGIDVVTGNPLLGAG